MTIAKNTFYYTTALVYQKILGFIYFILIGRMLGVTDTGHYVLAVSFTGLFFVLADIGLVKVMIKKIARKPKDKNILFNQIFTFKLLLSLITGGLIFLAANLMSYQAPTLQLIYLAGLVIILDSFTLINWGVFRGLHNLRYESLGILGFQTLTVGIGSLLLFLGYGVVPVMAASLLGSVFSFLFSFSLLVKKLKLQVKVYFNSKTFAQIIKPALPFALAGVFGSVYTMIDTVMLSRLGCEGIIQLCQQHVGWYGVAAKIILALQFIPLALSASLFPAFSRQFQQKSEKLIPTYIQAWRYLAFIVLPVAACIILLSPDLVTLIWGNEFLPAALPLQILMVSLVFIFLKLPSSSLLNATGFQLVNTKHMGLVVTINVLLNYLLIPSLAMTGAAIASLSSALIFLLLGFIRAYKQIRFSLKELGIVLLKVLVSSVALIIVIYALNTTVALWLTIVAGGVAYLSIAWLVKLIEPQDLEMVRQILPKRFS